MEDVGKLGRVIAVSPTDIISTLAFPPKTYHSVAKPSPIRRSGCFRWAGGNQHTPGCFPGRALCSLAIHRLPANLPHIFRGRYAGPKTGTTTHRL